MADPSAFESWLDGYRNAILEQDIVALKNLFSENARFLPTPFDRPIEGVDGITQAFQAEWRRYERSSLKVEKITEGWAQWNEGGSISGLNEPVQVSGILNADLESSGRCSRLVFWSHSLSASEADIVQQRDA